MQRPYPPAWSIIPQAFVRKERWLGSHKVPGTPLVSPGQDVVPDQPILCWPDTEKSFPEQPPQASAADRHKAQSLQPRPTQEIVPAGLRGRVVEITSRGGVVIETHATLVQGVIGAGDQVAGILTLWRSNSPHNNQTIPPGAILIIPGPLNLLLLRQILASGVVGVISSSITLRDLEGFLHVDLIEFLQEERTEQRMLLQQHFPPLTLLFTEGLSLDRRGSGSSLPTPSTNDPRRGSGSSLPTPSSNDLRRGSGLSLPTQPRMPANLINTLRRYEGSIALLSGETSFRHNIVPELIISLPPHGNQLASPAVQPDTSLVLGAQVRVYGGEHQGITGTIDYLFAYEQKFPSGLRARAARLRLEDGSSLIMPLFSLERIG